MDGVVYCGLVCKVISTTLLLVHHFRSVNPCPASQLSYGKTSTSNHIFRTNPRDKRALETSAKMHTKSVLAFLLPTLASAQGLLCSSTSQCTNGMQCYSNDASTPSTCGSYNATCTVNGQCSGNTCTGGRCVGIIGSVTTPSPSTPTGYIGLGAQCNETYQCALGADCFGNTAFTIKTCGSFNAACSSDAQCATNTCIDGLCKGVLASSAWKVTSTSTTSAISTSMSASATPTGYIGLGAQCNETSQCALEADCFGNTGFTIKTCGSFNAACSSDAQCATNTCVDGLCKGPLASSAWRVTSTSTAVTSATAGLNGTVTTQAVGTGFVTSTATNAATGTFGTVTAIPSATFTGGAGRVGVGFVAGVAGVMGLFVI